MKRNSFPEPNFETVTKHRQARRVRRVVPLFLRLTSLPTCKHVRHQLCAQVLFHQRYLAVPKLHQHVVEVVVELAGNMFSDRFCLHCNGITLSDHAVNGEHDAIGKGVEDTIGKSSDLSVIAGAEFDGSLKLKDGDGNTIARSEYDTAPVIGITFSSRF